MTSTCDNSNKAVNQHYLPQFYLKLFANHRKQLAMVRRDDDGALNPVIMTNYRNVCSRRFLYEVKINSESDKQELFQQGVIEEEMGRIESQLSTHYKRLLELLNGGDPFADESCVELVSWLGVMLALTIVRNPIWLDERRRNYRITVENLNMSDLFDCGQKERSKDLMVKDASSSLAEFLTLYTELFTDGPGTSLDSLFTVMEHMDVAFIEADQGSNFITASFPAYFEWLDASKNAPSLIYFPLSLRYAAVFRDCALCRVQTRFVVASEQAVSSLNRCLMNGSALWTCLLGDSESAMAGLIEHYKDR